MIDYTSRSSWMLWILINVGHIFIWFLKLYNISLDIILYSTFSYEQFIIQFLIFFWFLTKQHLNGDENLEILYGIYINIKWWILPHVFLNSIETFEDSLERFIDKKTFLRGKCVMSINFAHRRHEHDCRLNIHYLSYSWRLMMKLGR